MTTTCGFPALGFMLKLRTLYGIYDPEVKPPKIEYPYIFKDGAEDNK